MGAPVALSYWDRCSIITDKLVHRWSLITSETLPSVKFGHQWSRRLAVQPLSGKPILPLRPYPYVQCTPEETRGRRWVPLSVSFTLAIRAAAEIGDETGDGGRSGGTFVKTDGAIGGTSMRTRRHERRSAEPRNRPTGGLSGCQPSRLRHECPPSGRMLCPPGSALPSRRRRNTPVRRSRRRGASRWRRVEPVSLRQAPLRYSMVVVVTERRRPQSPPGWPRNRYRLG